VELTLGVRKMGRHPTGHRKWEIQHLWEVQHEVIRRLVIGQKPKDIARELDITPQTVSNIQNSRIARQEIERLRAERDQSAVNILDQVKSLAPKAVEVLKEVMDDPGARPSERIAAAKDVLDRSGYAPVKKVAELHAHLTPDDIARLREKGNEVARSVFGASGVEIVKQTMEDD